MTDSSIVQRVLGGEAEAFSLLVDRYHDRCARVAVHILGDQQDAEEVVQDSFLRAFRSLASYEDRELFGAWIYRIVVNQCRTRLAKRKRREETFPALDPADLERMLDEDAGDTTDERLDARHRLAAVLSHLPGDQREALVLKFGEDLSYEEMSAVTGVGVSALKMRVQRAFTRLRRLFPEATCV